MKPVKYLATVVVASSMLLGGVMVSQAAATDPPRPTCPSGWTDTSAGGMSFCRRPGATYSVSASEAWNEYDKGWVHTTADTSNRPPTKPRRNDNRWEDWAPDNGTYDHNTNTFTACTDAASCADIYIQTNEGHLRRKQHGTDDQGDPVYRCYFHGSDGSLHNYGSC